jgi:WD40 repeat protein/serine/threonine protein kinase
MTDRDDLSGRKLGEFVLRERFDEGGFGMVYRCEQPTLGREAVVKVLHHRLRSHDLQVQRFLREAQLASRLDHPYAAHVYAFGAEEDDGLLWIAMELVQGFTLKRWLADHGPMLLPQFVPFFEGVAEVVQTAHERGIVHRDLKPSNVMVIERAGRLLPKLLDFGVAKLLDGALLPESTRHTVRRLRALVVEHVPDEVLNQFRVGASTVTGNSPTYNGRLTPDGAPVGTPAYMAPEQWSSAVTVGPSSDLFALAVVAFEALTGRRPFEGTSRADFALLHCHGAVPPLGGSFPPVLDQMFQRALARRPEDRFCTALELAGALRAASGFGTSGADLPRIDAGVRDAWLADAPQPLAESVAVLDSARNAHQAHIAAQELARNLLRYLLAVALATRAQTREGQDDPALLKLVRALDRRELSSEERVRLLRLLVRPLTSRRSTHPIPELVDLVTPGPDGVDGLDPILALHAATEHAVTEDAVRSQLMRLIPLLTQLLRNATLALDYVLVVSRNHAAEQWAGRRRQPRAQAIVSNGELVDGHPMLLDRAGRVCVDLWPLVQAVPPADRAEPELFLYDGHGQHGALLISAPSGYEHDDAIARDWVASHVIAEIETKMRMRDQIQVAAHHWQDRDRPEGLLWRGDALAELERWMRHTAGAASLGDLEASFVAASRRAGRRARWLRRLLVVAPAMVALAVLEYRATLRTHMVQQLADMSVTQAEVEQGRQSLLHDDLAEAQAHLMEAYRRGDHSPAVAFMLARAFQSRASEQARLASTSGRTWSAAFSPDGRWIVTTDDSSARVWDARTSGPRFTLPHGDTVFDARYSADGAQIVTAGGDGIVRIWNASDGALVRAMAYTRAAGKRSRYLYVAWSPDDRLVAAIDARGEVAHVWSARTGAPVAELRNDASEVPALAFSADGRWLATTGGDEVRVFDTSTWKQLATIPGPRIRGLSFDPTGPRLATGTLGGAASIWELPSGAQVRHLREIGEPIDAVAFAPDGQLIAIAETGGAEQVWNARSGALQSQGNFLRGKISSIEFDPTSKLLVAAGASGIVIVSDALLGLAVTVLDGPQSLVMVAHFDASSRRVVGASWDGTARVWDATSPYRRWTSPPIADDCGLAMSLEPDRRFIAVSCRNRATRVWDTARDRLLAELPSATPAGPDFEPAFPAVSADGDRAAIARGNAVEVYELPGGRLLRSIKHGRAVTAVAFAPSGHDLVSGAVDGSLLVTHDGREPTALPVSAGGIDVAGLLPDGRAVAVDARGQLRVYDANRGAVLAALEVPTRARLLRPSSDGLRLVTIPSHGGRPSPPILWDLERYRPIARLPGHGQSGRVFSARFFDEDREIGTVGNDGTVRLWDAAAGRLVKTYRAKSRFLTDVAVDPYSSVVMAGGSDGVLWFWDRATARPVWRLQVHKGPVVGVHLEDNGFVTRGFGGDVSRWTLPGTIPGQVLETCDPERGACGSLP